MTEEERAMELGNRVVGKLLEVTYHEQANMKTADAIFCARVFMAHTLKNAVMSEVLAGNMRTDAAEYHLIQLVTGGLEPVLNMAADLLRSELKPPA